MKQSTAYAYVIHVLVRYVMKRRKVGIESGGGGC